MHEKIKILFYYYILFLLLQHDIVHTISFQKNISIFFHFSSLK